MAPSTRGRVEEWPARILTEAGAQELPDPVVVEEPLEIALAAPGVEAVPFTVTLRTPGEDEELAAGLLHAEALVDGPGDLVSLEARPEAGRVVAELGDARRIAPVLGTRRLASTAACGLCGKTSLDGLFAGGLAAPEPGRPRIARARLAALPERMRRAQALFARTGGLHAAALFDAAGELLVLREDVGRHNAVDKVLGERLLAGALPLEDVVLVVSGRAGFEIAQKAARARVGLLAAVGAPSSLALRIAARVGLTVVGFLRPDRLNVYTAPERVEG